MNYLPQLFFLIKNHFFWLLCVARGILVPQPATEPKLSALEMQSLNHWTAKEVPHNSLYVFSFLLYRIRFIEA